MSTLNRGVAVSGLISALQTIDGTGTFTYDLSGSGQVVEGRTVGPPKSSAEIKPRGWVWSSRRTESSRDRAIGADLSHYGQRMEITAVIFARHVRDSTGATEGANLEADIVKALHADRNLGGAVIDLEVDSEVIASADLLGWVCVFADVRVYWRRL